MTSENQNDFFNWSSSSTIDSGTLHRISIEDLVAQQHQDNHEDSSQQQQDLADQIQSLNNQLQNVASQQSQLEETTTSDVVGSVGNTKTETIPVTITSSSSSSSQQANLPLGIYNPDAILPTNRTYTCRICQVTFPNKSAVTVHSRLHTNHEGKPFRCNFCNKGFSTNFYLKQHERIHNGQKPYKCPMCERSFKQLSHVQQHVRTHTGVRPYKCHWPGCGKAFLQQSHLKSHVARHSPKPSNGVRPFKCHWPDCGKSFAQLNNLKSHIARHQPKKKKPAAEDNAEEQQQITIQVKQIDEETNAEDGGFTMITPNLIGQAAAAANIMPDTAPENAEAETIRPFLCPGCSKLYVREATFKKHLEECKTKLQLSISATAAALGIDPPSLPTSNTVITQQQDTSGISTISENSQSEKPASKKRKLSKTIRKPSQDQQQLLEQHQQLMTSLPIEVSLENNDNQIVSDAHNLNDVQVKQEVITLTTDGAGNLIQQGSNNNTMYKLPQILEGHGIIQNNQIVFNTGASGNLVVTAPLNNSNDGLFSVNTSNHQNSIHVTSLDSTISDQLLTSSTSPISNPSPSNTSVSMPVFVSPVLSTSQGLAAPQNSTTTVVAKIEDGDSDSIPGHSTINQAALRWQWDQPVRLNFP